MTFSGGHSMIIAHRGLLNGPDPELENHPDQINRAFDAGFDAEVDAWYTNGGWYLGHDIPRYAVDMGFFYSGSLWIHCKNIEAFYRMMEENPHSNYFYHDSDPVVLTSRGAVWTYFGKPETRNQSAICVMPEVTYRWDEIERMARNREWAGYCTDHPSRIRQWIG